MAGLPVIHDLALAVATNPGPSRDYITLGGQVLIAMISALALIIVGWFQFVYKPRTKKQNGVLETIRDQVQNTHETNMRDDIDKALAAIAEVKDLVRSGMSDVRSSVRVIHEEITTMRDDNSGIHEAVAGLRKEVTQIRTRK